MDLFITLGLIWAAIIGMAGGIGWLLRRNSERYETVHVTEETRIYKDEPHEE
jgi:hypothetical protein